MTDSYKGVRDFYPEDERIQRHLFEVMEKTAESFGYEPYNASILEPTELYTEKTSAEIVNEQTYTFIDRGGRSVTLRPDMTPTAARMVAARRRELGYPLRWYSIPNCFRYERPQKGRLREFWQLNVDMFGAEGAAADAEIIEIAYRLLRAYGATEDMFVIRVADRALLETAFDASGLNREQKQAYRRLLDRKEKMSRAEFEKEAHGIAAETDPLALIEGRDPSVAQALTYVENVIHSLRERGLHNVIFDPSIVRGFDYYTGIVFEVFDTSEKNTRSLFGGGRYDYLVGEYLPEKARGAGEHIPAVGFGMGDVTARDFLETHNLLPEKRAETDLYLAPLSAEDVEGAAGAAQFLRAKGLKVALGMRHEKLGDHIKAAGKLAIPFFAAFGERERREGMLTVKHLPSKAEKTVPLEQLPRTLEAMMVE